MKNSISILFVLLAVCTLLLSGCGGDDEGSLLATGAAQTVMVVNAQQTAMAEVVSKMTQDAAQATITPAATLPPLPSPTLAGSPLAPVGSASTQAAPAVSTSGDLGQYVSDTIKDGTTYNPGTKFTQTWTLQNIGTTTWTADYAVVFVSGDKMGAADKVNIPYSISPGMVVPLSVTFTAPTELGTYKSIWMLQNAAGGQFGLGANNGSFWVSIQVSNLPTATVTPQATGTSDASAVESAGVTKMDRDESQHTCSHYNINIWGVINTKNAVHAEYYWDLTYSGNGSGAQDSDIKSDDPDGSDFGVGPWGTSVFDVKDNETVKACLVVKQPANFSGSCQTHTIECD